MTAEYLKQFLPEPVLLLESIPMMTSSAFSSQHRTGLEGLDYCAGKTAGFDGVPSVGAGTPNRDNLRAVVRTILEWVENRSAAGEQDSKAQRVLSEVMRAELLRVFPRGWGQLVDRGFSSCTAAYENLLQCFFPAFAKDLCRSTILDAKLQSSDRYVVETFFSRVKEFLLLSTTVPVERAWQLESAWVCALSATDLYAPLRPPVSWEATQQAMRDAKSPLVEALRVEAAGRPLPWMFREFA